MLQNILLIHDRNSPLTIGSAASELPDLDAVRTQAEETVRRKPVSNLPSWPQYWFLSPVLCPAFLQQWTVFWKVAFWLECFTTAIATLAETTRFHTWGKTNHIQRVSSVLCEPRTEENRLTVKNPWPVTLQFICWPMFPRSSSHDTKSWKYRNSGLNLWLCTQVFARFPG